MSKRADKEWGEMWSEEKEMDCRVALQVLASSIYEHWRQKINRESQTTSGEWVEGVGLGNIHDIWNIMYHDMQALYTLEQLVNTHYKTNGISNKERQDKCEE